MTKDFNIENEIHHFWLDHLEVYWTFKYEKDLFEKLDFDNSNYWELDEYTFTKNEVNKFEYKILFTKDNYSLFAYYKWIPKGDKQWVATKDYVVVYSTAFKLMEYEEILYFLEFYFDLEHCWRFDICIDLKVNIDELIKYFNDYKTWREYRKSWKLETRYIWEVRNTLNKRQIIRIYDKFKDIVTKKKIRLYEDYLVLDNVTRVELEVRQELAKKRTYKEVFDNALLLWIFKNYLYKHSKIFDIVWVDKITLHTKKEKLDSEKFQSLYYKIYRKNIFVWHAKAVYNLWFCPVRVLIWEWYIQDKTKILLWAETIADLYNKERELKQNAKDEKWFRENVDDIINNLYKYGKV